MLSDVIEVLADPATGQPLSVVNGGSAIESAQGHRFNIAPAGYAVFATGQTATGDDSAMVDARETFLSRGHFGPFVEAVTEAVHDALEDLADSQQQESIDEPVIVDLGAGTGYYLAHTLDDVSGARGIGIDISEPAATRLAGSHRRVTALLADANAKLPFADHSVDVITVVFAPNNPQECARVLKPGGQMVVLTAVNGHLSQLRAPLGIVDVDPGALAQVHRDVAGFFDHVADSEPVEFSMNLDQDAIAGQIGMSPSAQHIDPQVLAQRVETLPKRMTVTAKAVVDRFRPRT